MRCAISLFVLLLLASPGAAALRLDWAVADLPEGWHLLVGHGEKGVLGGFARPLWGENPSPAEDLFASSSLIVLLEGEEVRALEERLKGISPRGEPFSLGGVEAELYFLKEGGKDSCYALLRGLPPRAIALSLVEGGRSEALRLLSAIRVEEAPPRSFRALSVDALEQARGLVFDGRGGL